MNRNDLAETTLAKGPTAPLPESPRAPAGTTWIWPSRIPVGAVSVVVGQAGAVTSLVGSTIIATIANGGSWPNAEAKADCGGAIVVAPDSVLTVTILPQLDAAGANLPKIGLGYWNRLAGTVTGVMKQLAAGVQAIPNTRLLVLHWAIDLVDQEYVPTVHKLDLLAKQRGVAVLIVAHVDGLADSKKLHAAMEMFAGAPAVSSVFHVAVDYQAGRHLLLPVKNTLGYETMGFAFHVRPRASSSGAQAATLEWDPTPAGRPPKRSAQRAASNKGHKEREAMGFVRETLGKGAMLGKRLTALAEGAGISAITLRRAVEKLGVVKSAGTWRMPKPSHNV